ncbi:MAG TPA: mechanosensitive ion channel family protein [Anaerolineae bacterium]|nr:mechanosensitive ion channel family protein [Anaerolineae bacterium]
MKRTLVLYLVLGTAALLVLLSATGWTVLAQTPPAGLLVTDTPEPGAELMSTSADVPTGLVEDEVPAPTATGVLDDLVETRTPEPTATAGLITDQVDSFTQSIGLAQTAFLGLSAADWINLLISVLLVLAGYMVGTLLIRRWLPAVVRRTPSTLDDKLLQAAGPNLRWLVVVLVLHLGTRRLTFLGAEVKMFLVDVYFVLGLAICFHITWRLVDLAAEWYRERLAEEERLDDLDPVLVLLVRLARIVAIVVGLAVFLSHFGVSVIGFAAVLGVGGLAISLAAQDTIADAIAGFIILVDRPFRMGDRIEIQGVGTWGDVLEIGLRTTRIRTLDNRMVIVPNSIIGQNQVINYTFPDPRYRIQTHVGIAYGTDIETARRLIVDTVRQLEGVLPDKPVDALYHEMGDSAMIFRVRWWNESYTDTRRIIDQVHTALQGTLDAADIEMPYPTEAVNVQIDPEAAERLAQAFREPGQ